MSLLAQVWDSSRIISAGGDLPVGGTGLACVSVKCRLEHGDSEYCDILKITDQVNTSVNSVEAVVEEFPAFVLR